jgi:rhodanese-related sulfurtransferase
VARTITTEELRKLIADREVQVVEVLPEDAYAREHLPGALSIPLAELPKRAGELDSKRVVVTYCFDYQCDLSARAASLLEALGFEDAVDYTASKAAWLASGHPAEGETRETSRAGFLCRPVPRCTLDETTGEIADRFDSSGVVVAVSDDDVVLGVLRREVAGLPSDTSVLRAMQPAPATVRPGITASELAGSMEKDERRYVLVTTLHGHLLGIIERDDLHGEH